MAVFRIEKTRDYTVMANHHLRNTALSLKAKGLLSLMLSLPEDWDYTTKGLARICRDGVDSICATVRELEDAGYIMQGLCPSLQAEFPGGGVVLSALSFQPFQKVRELGFKMGEETACGGFSV